MLAQNFKTPADLKISDAEFDALFKVLGMLERDEVRRAETYTMRLAENHGTTPMGFHMGTFYGANEECGTVCCICGWAEFVGHLPAGSLMRARFFNSGLMKLFDPTGTFDSDKIGTQQAAIALRNYLTHGEPRWDEALAE